MGDQDRRMLLAIVLSLGVYLLWFGSFGIQKHSQAEDTNNARFALTDHNGKQVTETDFAEYFLLIFFGYSHCPDICPNTLLNVAETMDSLGEDANKLLPIFVSVDPKRDTVDHMRTYVKNFHPSIVGLTGTEEQLKQMTDAYKVFYAIRDTEDSAMGYQVDHSGYLYLMGPNGDYLAHYPHNISAPQLKEALIKEMKG